VYDVLIQVEVGLLVGAGSIGGGWTGLLFFGVGRGAEVGEEDGDDAGFTKEENEEEENDAAEGWIVMGVRQKSGTIV
jgi:hypothetical protein